MIVTVLEDEKQKATAAVGKKDNREKGEREETEFRKLRFQIRETQIRKIKTLNQEEKKQNPKLRAGMSSIGALVVLATVWRVRGGETVEQISIDADFRFDGSSASSSSLEGANLQSDLREGGGR
ncbi:hypothetical protein L2E82_45723 [Cichorium intybus]|uniref:Uncharacterized protein n=1 Tax=Cichorium intybus TaxID=13427 RepID=A0ACB8ZY60_CICIN|nr:hypothetical protein L2E82_45723 [Cichorium intybus]